MSDYNPIDTDSLDQARHDSGVKEKLSQQTEAEDIKWLMGSKRGRRIVWRGLDRAGVYRLSFNTNSMTMAFAEGGRNEGLRMTALIQRNCPELYTLMLKEAHE